LVLFLFPGGVFFLTDEIFLVDESPTNFARQLSMLDVKGADDQILIRSLAFSGRFTLKL
jgi:hypothetical protein